MKILPALFGSCLFALASTVFADIPENPGPPFSNNRIVLSQTTHKGQPSFIIEGAASGIQAAQWGKFGLKESQIHFIDKAGKNVFTALQKRFSRQMKIRILDSENQLLGWVEKTVDSTSKQILVRNTSNLVVGRGEAWEGKNRKKGFNFKNDMGDDVLVLGTNSKGAEVLLRGPRTEPLVVHAALAVGVFQVANTLSKRAMIYGSVAAVGVASLGATVGILAHHFTRKAHKPSQGIDLEEALESTRGVSSEAVHGIYAGISREAGLGLTSKVFSGKALNLGPGDFPGRGVGFSAAALGISSVGVSPSVGPRVSSGTPNATPGTANEKSHDAGAADNLKKSSKPSSTLTGVPDAPDTGNLNLFPTPKLHTFLGVPKQVRLPKSPLKNHVRFAEDFSTPPRRTDKDPFIGFSEPAVMEDRLHSLLDRLLDRLEKGSPIANLAKPIARLSVVHGLNSFVISRETLIRIQNILDDSQLGAEVRFPLKQFLPENKTIGIRSRVEKQQTDSAPIPGASPLRQLTIDTSFEVEGTGMLIQGIRTAWHRLPGSRTNHLVSMTLNEYLSGRRRFYFVRTDDQQRDELRGSAQQTEAQVAALQEVMLYVVHSLKADRAAYYSRHPNYLKPEKLEQALRASETDPQFYHNGKVEGKYVIEVISQNLVALEDRIKADSHDLAKFDELLDYFKTQFVAINSRPPSAFFSLGTVLDYGVFNRDAIYQTRLLPKGTAPKNLVNLHSQLVDPSALVSGLYPLLNQWKEYLDQFKELTADQKRVFDQARAVLVEPLNTISEKDFNRQEEAIGRLLNPGQRGYSGWYRQRQSWYVESEKYNSTLEPLEAHKQALLGYLPVAEEQLKVLPQKYVDLIAQLKTEIYNLEKASNQEEHYFADEEVPQETRVYPQLQQIFRSITSLQDLFKTEKMAEIPALKEAFRLATNSIQQIESAAARQLVEEVREGRVNSSEALEWLIHPDEISAVEESLESIRDRSLVGYESLRQDLLNSEWAYRIMSEKGVSLDEFSQKYVSDLSDGVLGAVSSILSFGKSDGSAGSVFRGKALFSGSVRGRIRLVQNPGAPDWRAESGEIVVLPFATTRLSALKNASGAIFEEGGIFSHAARIAGETKMKAVIGARGAIETIHREGLEGKTVELTALENSFTLSVLAPSPNLPEHSPDVSPNLLPNMTPNTSPNMPLNLASNTPPGSLGGKSPPEGSLDLDRNVVTVGSPGGKGQNLQILSTIRFYEEGVSVPPYLYLKTDYVSEFYNSEFNGNKLQHWIREEMLSSDSEAEKFAKIKTYIERVKLPAGVIENRVQELGMSATSPLIARSSHQMEDGKRSFSGLFESVENLTTLDEVKAGIKRVLISAFSPEVLEYVKTQKIQQYNPFAMAVILQRFINDAEVSGVAFSQRSGAQSSPVQLQLMKGVGGGVDGRGYPDEVVVNTESNTILSGFPGENRTQLLLSPQTIKKIARVVKQIEERYGVSIEVEFAIKKHSGQDFNLHLVQSKPNEQDD